jgi:cytochrome c2
MSLEARIANKTLTDIAADMWNHAPKMTQKADAITRDDIRSIISHVWASSYFRPTGDASRGQHVFQGKGCAGCHEGGGAPAIKGQGEFSAMTLVSALWKHGPQMQARMQQKGTEWPQLTPGDTANLIAYLNSK